MLHTCYERYGYLRLLFYPVHFTRHRVVYVYRAIVGSNTQVYLTARSDTLYAGAHYACTAPFLLDTLLHTELKTKNQ